MIKDTRLILSHTDRVETVLDNIERISRQNLTFEGLEDYRIELTVAIRLLSDLDVFGCEQHIQERYNDLNGTITAQVDVFETKARKGVDDAVSQMRQLKANIPTYMFAQNNNPYLAETDGEITLRQSTEL